jgi:protein TonB
MKLDPRSMGLSAIMVGTMMAGLIFSAPDFIKKPPTTVLEGTNIPIPPPPSPEPEPLPKNPEVIKTEPQTHIIPPEQTVTINRDPIFVVDPGPARTEIVEGTGTGLGGGEISTKPAPVLVGPQVNPRFNYQPDYPANERRLGREGRVVVRVLVGTDGRVKEVEKVSAASDSFFEATRRRALEKWRLTPGTKGGVPIEAWRTMSVSFVMNDE